MMINRNRPRADFLLVLIGAAALAYTSVTHATGLLAAIGQGAEAGPVPQWPVLHNAAQEPVGLFGGLVSAYDRRGEIHSATLLILPTGYVMPVLHNGETATFAVAYYDQDDCKGREYLAPSGVAGSLLPTRGMVYRSPTTDALVYLPKDVMLQPVAVRSRWLLSNAAARCEAFVQTHSLLSVRPNQAAMTGVDPVLGTGALTLTVESAAAGRPRSGKSAEQSRNVRPVTEDSPDDAATLESLPECSPGCLLEAVGNGICDIACYYPACSHDGGDCAAMKPEELAEELAQICAPGCNRADVGDGFCDVACQNDACDQDGGDCVQQAPEDSR